MSTGQWCKEIPSPKLVEVRIPSILPKYCVHMCSVDFYPQCHLPNAKHCIYRDTRANKVLRIPWD